MKFFKTLRKRGLALFVAFIMCLSYLPVDALAADNADKTRIQPGVAQPVGTDGKTFNFPNLTIAKPASDQAKLEAVLSLDIYFEGQVGVNFGLDDVITLTGNDNWDVSGMTSIKVVDPDTKEVIERQGISLKAKKEDLTTNTEIQA